MCVRVRNARKEFITAKYVERRYVLPKEHSEPLRVYDVIKSRDMTSLLQLYAEGEDLSKPTAVPEQKVSCTCTTVCTEVYMLRGKCFLPSSTCMS